jgi:Txe/YoeB family toxin of Txe-Axe toxin-antitoxin module
MAQALALLSALAGSKCEHAEQYVRRIPATTRTAYRVRFEQELHWMAMATQ